MGKGLGHDPKRWTEFCKRYKLELKNPEVQAPIANAIQAARSRSVMTLIYGANDTEHNEAVVLLPVFKRMASKSGASHTQRRGKAPKENA